MIKQQALAILDYFAGSFMIDALRHNLTDEQARNIVDQYVAAYSQQELQQLLETVGRWNE